MTAFVAVALVAMSGCKKDERIRTPEENGAHLFAITCVRCHGADGKGGPIGPLGEPAPQNFTDPVFQAGIDDVAIGRSIRNGKGRGMPAFGAVFTDAQVHDLTLHVRSFAPPAARAVVEAGLLDSTAK